MATRSITNTKDVFFRSNASNPNLKATFEFRTDPSRPGLTRITLPEKSTWTPGPHWHEQHTEYFRVVKGRVIVIRNGVETIAGPEDGPLRIDKFVGHEFMRADARKPDSEIDFEQVVTEEWTDPDDGIKHLFFRNIFSTIEDASTYWKNWTSLQALFIAANTDDYGELSLLSKTCSGQMQVAVQLSTSTGSLTVAVQFVPGRLSYATTHTIYALVRMTGSLLGLKAWYEEYTPVDLRVVAVSGSK